MTHCLSLAFLSLSYIFLFSFFFFPLTSSSAEITFITKVLHQVYLSRKTDTGEIVALKVMDKTNISRKNKVYCCYFVFCIVLSPFFVFLCLMCCFVFVALLFISSHFANL